jgi:hypothetical protein
MFTTLKFEGKSLEFYQVQQFLIHLSHVEYEMVTCIHVSLGCMPTWMESDGGWMSTHLKGCVVGGMPTCLEEGEELDDTISEDQLLIVSC